jgi:hypothetical protein
MRLPTALYQSPLFNIGQPFKVTKVRIPLPVATSYGAPGYPGNPDGYGPLGLYLELDSGSRNAFWNFYPDDNANKYSIVWQPITDSNFAHSGHNNFILEIWWGGSDKSGYFLPLAFPITIDYELLDVEQDG